MSQPERDDEDDRDEDEEAPVSSVQPLDDESPLSRTIMEHMMSGGPAHAIGAGAYDFPLPLPACGRRAS